MTIFTYCQVRKSFFVALAVMVTGLFILKFSSADNYMAHAQKQGQSVITLKNIYRSVSKKSFTAVKSKTLNAEPKKITYYKDRGSYYDLNTIAFEEYTSGSGK